MRGRLLSTNPLPLLLLLTMLLMRCVSPVSPATTPPPPVPVPVREVLAATIAGRVTEPGGMTAAPHARVSAILASPGCLPTAERVETFADERGEFSLTLEAGTGPDVTTCVLVEAGLGGASGSAELRDAHFRTISSTVQPERFRVDIVLAPVSPLTVAEAEAILSSFVALLNGDDRLRAEMSTYTGGPEALRTALEDFRSLLGEGITHTITRSSNARVDAVLRGSKGATLTVFVSQPGLRTLHGPLIDYSLPSRLWAASFSRLVAAGEPEPLARFLSNSATADAVGDAQRIIDRYKPPFDAEGGRFELVAVDERRETLTYRLTWFRADQAADSLVEISYANGSLTVSE